MIEFFYQDLLKLECKCRFIFNREIIPQNSNSNKIFIFFFLVLLYIFICFILFYHIIVSLEIGTFGINFIKANEGGITLNVPIQNDYRHMNFRCRTIWLSA